MKYNNPITQRAARLVNLTCSSLFLAFTLIDLLHVQKPLLAHVLKHYAEPAQYRPLIATSVIVVIMLLPPFFLLRYIDFPIRWKAFIWAPSAIILTWLTDVALFLPGGHHQPASPIIYAVVLALTGLVLWLLRQSPDPRELRGSYFTFIVPNLLILLLLFVFIVSVSNFSEADHQLLQRNLTP